MPFTAEHIARELRGSVRGNGAVLLTGFAPALTAQPGDLTFAENEEFFRQADQSAASAILVDKEFGSESKVLILVPNARIAFARVLPLFFPEDPAPPGIHPSAVIDPSARVAPSSSIGPHCAVGPNVVIGEQVRIDGSVHIGGDCRIGDRTRLFPNVTIYPRTQIGCDVRIHAGTVIGSDGFGYVFDSGVHRKIPQVGQVIIQDFVEIGANVCIDRGALGATTIGAGTKIDNLVQIAHNVVMGEHCLIIAQVGIAGSAVLGKYVTVAGQAGIAGHVRVGNRVTVAGKSGIMHQVPDGEKWMGTPIAQPERQAKRELVALHRLPDLLKRVAALEKKLGLPPQE